MKIEINKIGKKYEGNKAFTLNNINLTIEDNDFCVLLGPSGCGKTTLLRMIAGLNSITTGDLLFDGRRVNEYAPKDRDIAMVFQSYALYPHMNVYNNIAFSLKLKRERKSIIDRRVKDVAKILNIYDYIFNKPSDLSGGQRQRVALGRAIARKPKIFLMDEPLSNLDAKLREKMRTELVNIHQMMDTTTIYVTHDQLEAMTMATKIVLMNNKRIVQIASPKEMYSRPNSIFAAKFIGSPSMNIVEGKMVDGTFIHPQFKLKATKSSHVKLLPKWNKKSVYLGVRPSRIAIAESEKDMKQPIKMQLTQIELLGQEQLLTLKSKDLELVVSQPGNLDFDKTKPYFLDFDTEHIHFFDKECEQRICDEFDGLKKAWEAHQKFLSESDLKESGKVSRSSQRKIKLIEKKKESLENRIKNSDDESAKTSLFKLNKKTAILKEKQLKKLHEKQAKAIKEKNKLQ